MDKTDGPLYKSPDMTEVITMDTDDPVSPNSSNKPVVEEDVSKDAESFDKESAPTGSADGKEEGDEAPTASADGAEEGDEAPTASADGAEEGDEAPTASADGAEEGDEAPTASADGAEDGDVAPTASGGGAEEGDVAPTASGDGAEEGGEAPTASADGAEEGDARSLARPAEADTYAVECYRYEEDVCIYTDPSSGVEYVYSADKEGWLRRDGSDNGHPLGTPLLENCFYVGEHYCFRDPVGRLYRLLADSNSWQEWTDAPAGAGTEPGRDYFSDATGRWYYRDADGRSFGWDEAEGCWRGRAAGSNKRPHRQDRGSSDDSEHDTDEDVETVTAGAQKLQYKYTDDGTAIYTDPADGTTYEWDAQKSAWFPQVDEEFLALHSLNYGFDSEGRPVDAPPILQSAAPPPEEPSPAVKKAKQMTQKKQPEWFQLDNAKSSKVYVSGLPGSTTDDEFLELMSKCGLVMKDASNKWKIKLYKDDYGIPKGDGICTYIKVESVELALRILDGYQFKDNTITVERAQFNLKGDFNPKLKPKKRTLKRKDRERIQKKQEKLFAWQPDKIRGEREKHERVMVLKNAFSPEAFSKEPELVLEYRQDVQDECSKYGSVRKVVVHDRHPDGVVEVVFAEASESDACIKVMDGRWFGGRQLKANTWDGKSKYRIEETEEERKERLANWEKFISGDGGSGSTTAAADDTTAVDSAHQVTPPSAEAGDRDLTPPPQSAQT